MGCHSVSCVCVCPEGLPYLFISTCLPDISQWMFLSFFLLNKVIVYARIQNEGITPSLSVFTWFVSLPVSSAASSTSRAGLRCTDVGSPSPAPSPPSNGLTHWAADAGTTQLPSIVHAEKFISDRYQSVSVLLMRWILNVSVRAFWVCLLFKEPLHVATILPLMNLSLPFGACVYCTYFSYRVIL